MIDCTYIEASAGYHECRLKAADFKNFDKCGPESNCWALWIEWRNAILPHSICNVMNISITINGKALPVNIEVGKDTDWWRITMKDKPAADAILHWVIVPCAFNRLKSGAQTCQ